MNNLRFRIGITGINNSGKSILIKLLTNYLYLKPNSHNLQILREENFKVTDYPSLSKSIQTNIITIPILNILIEISLIFLNIFDFLIILLIKLL